LPSKQGSFDLAQLPSDLGGLIACDTALLQQLGWHGLVAHCCPTSIFASLDNLYHPAWCLLRLYMHRGALVKFATPPWTHQQLQCALSKDPHCSFFEYIDLPQEDFVDMINKGQWVILPAKAVLHLPGFQLSPPGVVPQCSHCPSSICDYSWWGVNDITLPLAAMKAMQTCLSLECILHEILLASPAHGPVHMIKLDISDGFYQITLNIDDIPKLGVVFPMLPGDEPLIAFPLVLSMGWINSPPIFLTATQTIADIANAQAFPTGCHLPNLWTIWLPLLLPHLLTSTGGQYHLYLINLTCLWALCFLQLGRLPLLWKFL
jgi:hypothetical protein